MRLNPHHAISQFVKFGLVGLLNTALAIFIFFILHEYLHVSYIIASIIAYGLGMVNSYLGNKIWTFKSQNKHMAKEAIRFIWVNLAGMVLNVILITAFVEIFNFKPLISQVLAVGIVVSLTFGGSKYWVFKS